jgi:hypothetical protein
MKENNVLEDVVVEESAVLRWILKEQEELNLFGSE